jgi:predicted dehydrogenase
VHRIAARLDDHYELVAGALSSEPARALRSAEAIGLPRAYPDYATMAREEAARPDGIEAVAIVTPNDQHAPAAEAFLRAGVHVICDKPVTTTLDEARRLKALVEETGRLFAVTHNYTGYPMVRHARQLVRDGALGEIRVVQVEYAQDWLTERLEATGQKQAAWRTDPKRSGAGGCIGDIGTHAFNLLHYVTGLKATEIAAELSTFVPGRALDDNVQVMLRLANGARGSLWASQVAPGNENGLRLRVYGSKGGIEWAQEHPNQLRHAPFGEPVRTLARGTGAVLPDGQRVTRLPSGHPEGYLEAFATVYAEIAQAIRAARTGQPVPAGVNFPTLDDGIDGLAFIEAAVRSSAEGGRWTRL